MTAPKADVNWGGTGDTRPGCGKQAARVLFLVVLVLGLLGGAR